jgi:serine/threonine protein kinase
MTITDLTNQILGNRYRLIHQVGKGGMALVFEAYDQMLERPVAIKLLRRDFVSDVKFRERFRQEAKSAANLSHPNIVTIHDFGIDPKEVYIVMEFVSGIDLKTKLHEIDHFSVLEGLNLSIQMCNGLGYAHRAGIVHCDVKPQNLILTSDNRIKIADFGIARALSSMDTSVQHDIVWGSPQYLAPELALGGLPTPASDVYSLGVVLYELFTGRLPFDADSIDELLQLQKFNEPEPPGLIIPNFPIELEKVILKVLSKEPSNRYRTADQLGSILTRLFDLLQIQPTHPVSRPNNKKGSDFPTPPPITHEDYPTRKTSSSNSVDWNLIGLELLCLLLLGGLIPFWLYVWFTIKPLLG